MHRSACRRSLPQVSPPTGSSAPSVLETRGVAVGRALVLSSEPLTQAGGEVPRQPVFSGLTFHSSESP